jgi:ATP-binding cassette subfamily B protein
MAIIMNEGLSCLAIVCDHFLGDAGRFTTEKKQASSGDLSLRELSMAAESAGFRTRIQTIGYRQLVCNIDSPCILPVGKSSYVVYFPGKNKADLRTITCVLPDQSTQSYARETFTDFWNAQDNGATNAKGKALLLEPAFTFKRKNDTARKVLSWGRVLRYFNKSRKNLFNIIFSLLIVSLLQLIFPFLTQSIVDVGINTQNLGYIEIVLIAQLVLVFSRTVVNFFRSYLLLYMSTKVNLAILSDFWIKLTHLPVTYFDRSHTGEILQRIDDNRQIQNFLTGPTLNTLFSLLNFVVFGIVLMTYQWKLFVIFAVGVSAYFGWMILFLKIRRKLNVQMFNTSSRENESTLQLVQGMQEIRLHNIEQPKRWEWEDIQTEVFGLRLKILSFNQLQQAGAVMINQGKDIVLTFIVAGYVMNGQLSLGSMLALTYIIGQLSGPVDQFINFVQDLQNAKISMERLNEVHTLPNEERVETAYTDILPYDRGIVFDGVSFSYPGALQEPVLHDVRLVIPEGKTTAIVGVSGSGKTTLLKLLLKFYDDYRGRIEIGGVDFRKFSPSFWRKNCGAVLQDGYIFNASIARNIAVEPEDTDIEKLKEACRIANILSFIETLPVGFDTILGSRGIDLSQGQKQRILIARAVYKDPAYLFFDESTNALDASNEKIILENLQEFYVGKTVVVIAHRLSTVKNADEIIVVHRGNIIERGTHRELSKLRGRYYDLVRDQIDLGS